MMPRLETQFNIATTGLEHHFEIMPDPEAPEDHIKINYFEDNLYLNHMVFTMNEAKLLIKALKNLVGSK